MKIKLTDEQIQKMDIVWRTLNDLHKDKKFMKMMQAIADDKESNLLTDENEDDYARVANFYDDLRDHANMFNVWN